jgi:general secretion pathway protein E
VDTLLTYRPVGCDACNQIGYKGRVGLYELFVMSEPIRRLIAREADSDALRAAAPDGTLFTIQQDAIQKVRDGITTVEEVLSQIHLQAHITRAA